MKPMSRNVFGVLAAILLLAGCATVSTPEYPRQHPANPDAIQGPAPIASSALDTYRPADRKARSGQTGAAAEPTSRAGHGSSAQEPGYVPRENDHDQR